MPIPTDVALAVAALTAGLIIPMTVTFTGVTYAVGPPGTITVTGTLIAQQFIFTVSHAMALTLTLAAAPSHDASDKSRIVSLAGSTITFKATGVPDFVTGGLAAFATGILVSKVESLFNSLILATLLKTLRNLLGQQLTPTATVSAFTVALSTAPDPGSPVAAALVSVNVGDLFGPGLVPIPGNLTLTIAPTPVANTELTYVVAVTNMGTGVGVGQLEVVLSNFNSTGQIVKSLPVRTAADGTARFTVSLHSKTTTTWVAARPIQNGPYMQVTETLFPTVSVTDTSVPPLFNSLQQTLSWN
jgi:hypothetical protein